MVERKPVFGAASLYASEKEYPLELAQNINNIAFKTLQDRMIRELGSGLLRLATKKAIELAVREATKNSSKEDKVDAGEWLLIEQGFSGLRLEGDFTQSRFCFGAF